MGLDQMPMDELMDMLAQKRKRKGRGRTSPRPAPTARVSAQAAPEGPAEGRGPLKATAHPVHVAPSSRSDSRPLADRGEATPPPPPVARSETRSGAKGKGSTEKLLALGGKDFCRAIMLQELLKRPPGLS